MEKWLTIEEIEAMDKQGIYEAFSKKPKELVAEQDRSESEYSELKSDYSELRKDFGLLKRENDVLVKKYDELIARLKLYLKKEEEQKSARR